MREPADGEAAAGLGPGGRGAACTRRRRPAGTARSSAPLPTRMRGQRCRWRGRPARRRRTRCPMPRPGRARSAASAAAVAAVLRVEVARGGGLAADSRAERDEHPDDDAPDRGDAAAEGLDGATSPRLAALRACAPVCRSAAGLRAAVGTAASSSGCTCHRTTLTLNSTVTGSRAGRRRAAVRGSAAVGHRPAAARSSRRWLISCSVASTSGSPDRADVQAAQPQPGLDQDRALGAEDAGVDRQQPAVQAQRLGRCRRARTPRSCSGSRRRRSASTCRSRRPRRPTSAAASSRRRRSSRRGRSRPAPRELAARSPLASLTATIRSCSASAQIVSVWIGIAAAARDVVEDHRQVGGVGDRAEVRAARRPAAAWSSTASRRAARARRPSRPARRGASSGTVSNVPTPATIWARSPTASTDRPDQVGLLGVGGRRRLAAGAADDQGVVALLVDEVGRQFRGLVEIDLTRRSPNGVTIAVSSRPNGRRGSVGMRQIHRSTRGQPGHLAVGQPSATSGLEADLGAVGQRGDLEVGERVRRDALQFAQASRSPARGSRRRRARMRASRRSAARRGSCR